jgi:hypothetical protein
MYKDGIYLVAMREEAFIKGYEQLVKVDEKYILGNGILINNQGKTEWSTSWEHDYFHAMYLKEQNVLLTNRRSCPGPVTADIGICCIDFNTGEYLWKNWYEDSLTERFALMKKEPDVKLNSWFSGLEPNGEWIWSGCFRIHIQSGYIENYNDLANEEKQRILSTLIELPPSLPDVYSCSFVVNSNPYIQFGVREVTINQKSFTKEGYFFNKCNAVFVKEPYYYFFGIPENKNPNGSFLFKYSVEEKRIVKEIQLPFRYPITGVFDFFQTGILVYEQKWGQKPVNALWVIENDVL